MKTWTARPTTYRGTDMRSRLEAKVAAAFDNLGIAWKYEPRAYATTEGQYLPDFEIPSIYRQSWDDDDRFESTGPVLVEVRPTYERVKEAWARETRILVLAGANCPLVYLGWWSPDNPLVGYIGLPCADTTDTADDAHLELRGAAIVQPSRGDPPVLLIGQLASIYATGFAAGATAAKARNGDPR